MTTQAFTDRNAPDTAGFSKEALSVLTNEVFTHHSQIPLSDGKMMDVSRSYCISGTVWMANTDEWSVIFYELGKQDSELIVRSFGTFRERVLNGTIVMERQGFVEHLQCKAL